MPKSDSNYLERLTTKPAMDFRARLRRARDGALADAEGYRDLLCVIEELGKYATNKKKADSLFDYSDALIDIARQAAGAPNHFPSQLDALREARNDAAHMGAAARRITTQAIDVAGILEEALMNIGKLKSVEHYMVGSPVCAEPWHTLAMVRKAMLHAQFTSLPYLHDEKWHLVTDAAVVKFLSSDRNRRLNMPLRDAVVESSNRLDLIEAKTERGDTAVENLRQRDARDILPILVLDGEHLRGILAPFDLL